MVGRLSMLCVAAIAAVGIFAVAPTVALADDGCHDGSATSIYVDCIPTASGGTHGHHKGPAHPTTPSSSTPTYVQTPTVAPIKVTKKVQRTLKHAGHDKQILTKIVTDPWLGATRAVRASSSFRATKPSALGAVFDLGSGPTALFALLAALAILFFGVGGLHSRRRRQN